MIRAGWEVCPCLKDAPEGFVESGGRCRKVSEEEQEWLEALQIQPCSGRLRAGLGLNSGPATCFLCDLGPVPPHLTGPGVLSRHCWSPTTSHSFIVAGPTLILSLA